MVKGIEHVAIFSKDTKALSDWYKDMFSLRIVYDNGKGTYFAAFESGDMIEFVKTDITDEKKHYQTEGIRHLALTIDDDKFEPMVDKLKAAGVEVVVDVAVSSSGIKTFLFRDIDSNLCHLIVRPTPLV